MRRKDRPVSGRRHGRAKRHAPALEWLKDAADGAPRATLVGRDWALVESHTGILEFTPECVRLEARGGEIAVRGAELQLEEVRADALIVRGRIDALLRPSAGEEPHD